MFRSSCFASLWMRFIWLSCSRKGLEGLRVAFFFALSYCVILLMAWKFFSV